MTDDELSNKIQQRFLFLNRYRPFGAGDTYPRILYVDVLQQFQFWKISGFIDHYI